MKKFLIVLLALLLVCAPALAYNSDFVVDDAELLTDSQESELESKLQELYENYHFQIVVHTTRSSGYQSLDMYAADFYDENGYGYGASCDGLIFAVDMAKREYVTVTTGSGMALFSDYDIARVEEMMVDDLSEGNYARAFDRYADGAEDVISAPVTYGGYSNYGYYDDGVYYDEYGMQVYVDVYRHLSPAQRAGEILPGILIAAAVITAITLGVMISGMKTARKKNQAMDYMTHVNLTRQSDIYLYTTERRRKIQTQNNHHGSSGGHSSFRGSSGRSHGGGRVGRF